MQAPAGSNSGPPAVCTEAHRLDFHHISGFRLVAEDTRTGHFYAVDIRRPESLSTAWLYHFSRYVVDADGCPDCWDAEAAERFLSRFLEPHFDQARFGSQWLHLPLITGDELCPACSTTELIDHAAARQNGGREVAHAG